MKTGVEYLRGETARLSAKCLLPDFRGEIRWLFWPSDRCIHGPDSTMGCVRFLSGDLRRLTGNLDWINRLYCNDFALFHCTSEFDPCTSLPSDDVPIQCDGANGFAFSTVQKRFSRLRRFTKNELSRARMSAANRSCERGEGGYTQLVQRVAKDDSMCSMENLK